MEDEWVRIRIRSGTTVTADLIVSILRELYATKAYQVEKVAGLWDFRECRSDIKYEAMMKIKTYIDANYNPNWSHYLSAFVVDRESNYGLSRMYEMISDNLPTVLGIFKDMNQAQEWIREEILKGKMQDD